MKLTLIRGLPGSGKSTLAKFISGGIGHYEADMFFIDKNNEYKYDQSKIGNAHEWCKGATNNHLDMGYDTVVSNTFTTIRELRPYFEIAYEFGIIPNVILCQSQFKNIHDVPAEVLVKMKQRFCYDISPLFVEFGKIFG
jgi:predicted kinase